MKNFSKIYLITAIIMAAPVSGLAGEDLEKGTPVRQADKAIIAPDSSGNPNRWVPLKDGKVKAGNQNNAGNATASEPPKLRQIVCPQTPYSRTRFYPGKKRMIKSNKLSKPAGKSQFAEGQILHLKGKVRDNKCVPLRNAKIEIWHAGNDGKYSYATLDQLATPYPVFAGNGIAYTDNEGNYNFVTIFPGSAGRKAPHINMRITSEYTRPMDTVIYFAGNEANEKDPAFRSMRGKKKELLTVATENIIFAGEEAIEASFNIVLPGRDRFRDY